MAISPSTTAPGLTVPVALLAADPARVPPEPGVYVFRSAGGEAVYVGSTRNLRVRLTSYFQPARQRRRKEHSIARASAEVEIRPRPSEFHALLEEISLIQALAPPWNRRGKAPERYVYLWAETADPFPRLAVAEEAPLAGRCFGPFAIRGDLQRAVDAVCDAFGLRTCAGMLRPDPRSTACWRASVRLCTAPCLGKVSPGEYGRRLAAALHALADGGARSLAALERRRDELAGSECFESAARAQRRIAALRRLRAALRPLRLADDNDRAIVVQPGSRRDAAAVWGIAGGRVVEAIEGRPGELRAAFDALWDRCQTAPRRPFEKAEADAARAMHRWLHDPQNRNWVIPLRGSGREATRRQVIALAERACAPPAQLRLLEANPQR